MEVIQIPKNVYDEVVAYCTSRYPEQSRGIFASKDNKFAGEDFYRLESNYKRFEEKAKDTFKSYGKYYDSSKGFVTDPVELHKTNQRLIDNGQDMVGLFHVHIDFPAAPSRLDVETFESSFVGTSGNIWYAILSLLNKEKPEFRVFWIKQGLCQEVAVEIA